MPTYFLAPHVYPCVTEDHVVLLDLDRDKYVGVAREQVSALARAVSAGRMMHRNGRRGFADEKSTQCGWRYTRNMTGVIQ